MFDVKDNKVCLKKTKRLSPKQLARLNTMSINNQNRYILSILGLVKQDCIPVPRFKDYSIDTLRAKPEGHILRQMKQLQNVEHKHQPNGNHIGEWIGIEIECIIPHQDGNEGECNCEYDEDGNLEFSCDYCENGDNHWSLNASHKWLKNQLRLAGVTRCQVKEDGSVEDADGHGVEITILFNTKFGFEPLIKLINTLKKLGCFVNDTCGMHVHLDARHLSKVKALKVGQSLGHALPILKYLVHPDRIGNTFCELGVSEFCNIKRNNETWEKRYKAINLTSYFRYKTIEVRLHGGSLNATKIENWCKLLKVISNAKLKAPITTFQEFIEMNGMTKALIDYAEKRINKLNPDAWAKLNHEPLITQPNLGA